jgi:hypothetical protein
VQRDAIVREEFEWSNIWWDHADDLTQPRIQLVGDSISVDYGSTTTERLRGIAHVDRLSNSKSANDPALLKEIGYMLGEYRYSVIHFNNGLHGFHLPDDVYAQSLRRIVQLLIHYGQGARLVWAVSTPVTVPGNPSALDSEKNEIVCRRNALAQDIMREYGIPVNDLYSLVLNRPELSRKDGYHYNVDGQAVLGNKVSEVLLDMISRQED